MTVSSKSGDGQDEEPPSSSSASNHPKAASRPQSATAARLRPRHSSCSAVMAKETRIAGLYDIENTIGKGHFAVVKLARHVFTGEQVAVKIIDKTALDKMSSEKIMQEVRCMKLVQHPHIVRLYEVIDAPSRLFLILELGDYDMHTFIEKCKDGCGERLAQRYFAQIIAACCYCHELHVVHRDLKPENVIFFERLRMVKLTDFGFSNEYRPGERLNTACGSLAYSAPEILLGSEYDPPAVDVWSLGVLLYMLLCGSLPFYEPNDSETLTRILDAKYTIPDHVGAEAKALISAMLVREPAKRAALSDVAASEWVRAGDRGLATELPLVARQQLPEQAHSTIVDQMVIGGVGSEDAILGALEADEYNYMTATYYLLAERVLASCRELRARQLAEEAEQMMAEEEEKDEKEVSEQPEQAQPQAATRRACSILKEESEEELHSYYTRTTPGTARSSRATSPANVGLAGNSAAAAITAPNSTRILSGGGGGGGGGGGPSGRVESRVSPAAIQELLEVSRLSLRRAGSPPGTSTTPAPPPQPISSVRSSRSSSPTTTTTTSGRASPAGSMPTTSARYKALSLSTSLASVLSASGGGMRKLSSSPHLLGICEEAEESPSPGGGSGGGGGNASALFNQTPSSASGSTTAASTPLLLALHDRQHSLSERAAKLMSTPTVEEETGYGGAGTGERKTSTGSTRAGGGGTTRSASAGFVAARLSTLLPTYRSVRAIRVRQAIVSPDLLRRYEQNHHQAGRGGGQQDSEETEGETNNNGGGGGRRVPHHHRNHPTAHHHRAVIGSVKRSASCSSSEASDDDAALASMATATAVLLQHRHRRNSKDEPPPPPPPPPTSGGGGGGSGHAGGVGATTSAATAAATGTSTAGAGSGQQQQQQQLPMILEKPTAHGQQQHAPLRAVSSTGRRTSTGLMSSTTTRYRPPSSSSAWCSSCSSTESLFLLAEEARTKSLDDLSEMMQTRSGNGQTSRKVSSQRQRWVPAWWRRSLGVASTKVAAADRKSNNDNVEMGEEELDSPFEEEDDDDEEEEKEKERKKKTWKSAQQQTPLVH